MPEPPRVANASAHPQVRAGKHVEKGLITAGNDLQNIVRFLPKDGYVYHAADVIAELLQCEVTHPCSGSSPVLSAGALPPQVDAR